MNKQQVIPNWLFEAAVIVSLEELVVEKIKELVRKICFTAVLSPVGEAAVVSFSSQPQHCFTLLWAIAESHIAVHTWPEFPENDDSRGAFQLQISSCKAFEARNIYCAIGSVFSTYRISDFRLEDRPLNISQSKPN